MGWLTEVVEKSVQKVFDEKITELETKLSHQNTQNQKTNEEQTTCVAPPTACLPMQPLEDIQLICKNSSFPFQKFLEYEEAKMRAQARQQFGWSATAFVSTSLVVGAFSVRFSYLPIITLIPLSVMGLHASYLWSRGYGQGSRNVFNSIKQIMNENNNTEA